MTPRQLRDATSGKVARVRPYLALAKFRIIELLLITTVPSMVVAAQGWPSTQLVINTLFGGTLSAAGANALNQVIEGRTDALMSRTSWRPVARGTVSPLAAGMFGVVLGVGGFFWLWFTTEPLAALIATGALVFYVVVYTVLLKTRTAQNIVLGGAAGAAPVLVGWTAVNGSLTWPAWALFAIVFFWTPPHFWALAIRHSTDYANAGIPMLPNTAGVASTKRHMTVHTVAMVMATLSLVYVSQVGVLYGLSAVALGVWFLRDVRAVSGDRRHALRLFRGSIYYLTALFVILGMDVLLPV